MVDGGAGRDYVDGRDGNDVLTGGLGHDTVYGLSGDDAISGGDGQDYLEGATDHDLISGGAGDDMISGGRGDDTLFGGAGDDKLYGGFGTDALHGGTGGDTAFSQTGDSTSGAEKVVAVELKNLGSFIEIDGSPEFRARVEADLDMLRSSRAASRCSEPGGVAPGHGLLAPTTRTACTFRPDTAGVNGHAVAESLLRLRGQWRSVQPVVRRPHDGPLGGRLST